MTEEQLARHILQKYEGSWPIIKGCSGNAWWLPNDDPQRGQLLSINTVIAIIGYALAEAGAQVWQDKDCWRVVGSSHKKHPTHFHALFASAVAQGLVKEKP